MRPWEGISRAFSVIVKTDGSFAALQKRLDTSKWTRDGEPPDPSPSRAPAKLISPGHKKLVAGCLQIQWLCRGKNPTNHRHRRPHFLPGTSRCVRIYLSISPPSRGIKHLTCSCGSVSAVTMRSLSRCCAVLGPALQSPLLAQDTAGGGLEEAR